MKTIKVKDFIKAYADEHIDTNLAVEEMLEYVDEEDILTIDYTEDYDWYNTLDREIYTVRSENGRVAGLMVYNSNYDDWCCGKCLRG